MKTTLDLNDALLLQAKAQAAAQHTSLTRLIEESLRLRLHASIAQTSSAAIKLPVIRRRGGLRPGIDPLSNRSLLDALDDAS